MRFCKYILAFMKHMDWDDLRFFLAVAAAGSLSAAGKQLRVNTTTVLRRIANLEDALQTRLFERLRSGYTLTPDGTRLMETLDPVDQRLSALERDFQSGSQGAQGVVKLSAGEAVATHILAPCMQGFKAAHGDISLQILTDNGLETGTGAPRILNPLRDVDLTIRAARPTDGAMLMRKIGDMAYGLYGAPDFLQTQNGLSNAANSPQPPPLDDVPLIGFAEDEPPLGPVWWLSRAQIKADIVIRSSSAAARARMAVEGVGLACLPCMVGDGRQDLTRVVGPEIVGGLELWLLARRDMTQLTHIRASMDFLIARFKSCRGLLAGAP